MIHADKSKTLPGKAKAADVDAKGPKQALKGKSLEEQEKALVPPAPPAHTVRPTSPVAEVRPAPAPIPDAEKLNSAELSQADKDKAADKDAKAVAPVEKQPEPQKKPEVLDEREVEKVKEPEDKKKELEDKKEPETKKESTEDTKKEPEKPKGPSKKELRRQQAEQRKELQLGQREVVHNQRAERQDKRRKSDEKELQERNERREQIRREVERKQLKAQAEKVLERVNGLEPEVANALKENFKANVEKLIQMFSDEKATNENLSNGVTKATNSLDGVIADTIRVPEQQVRSGLVNLDSKGELTEARRYLGDRTLARQYNELTDAMSAGKWFTAKVCLAAVKESLDILTPLIKEVMTWQPKVTWTDNKTLVDKKGAEGEKQASPLKLAAVQKLADRYALGRNGLEKLAKWFKTDYEPFVQIPLTCSMWDTVKHDDGLAEGMLSTLLTAGVISGHYASTYKTSYDTGSDYSVEYTVRGIDSIVLHSHCTSSGTPKTGDNASHWKRKGSKKDKGGTHPISQTLMKRFMA